MSALPSDPVEREIELLRKRYASSLVVSEASSSGSRTVSLTIHPTDPDFKVDMPEGISLEATLPRAYPEEAPSMEITSQHLSDAVRVALNKAIAKQASSMAGGLAMRDLLRFLDNHFSLLHSCALEVATTKPHAAAAAAAAAPSPAEDWTPEQQAALQQALKDVPATIEAGERWKQIADKVPGRTKKECVARFKALKAALAGGGVPPQQPQPQQPQPQQQQQARDGEWTDSQQASLQAGLKEHPHGGALSGEERWKAIAEMVQGKTAQQCVERYRELHEKIMAAAKEAPTATAGGKVGVKKRDEGRISIQTIKFEVEVEKEEEKEEVEPSESEGSGSDDDDDDDGEGEGEGMEFQPLPDGASQGACQVKLNDLMLLGAGAAQALVASVTCACSRCGECYSMSLARGGEEEEVECKRCKRTLTMALHSDILHSEVGGGCMGWIEVRGCKVVDVLRMMLLASCHACSAGVRMSNVTRGARREANCMGCHAALSAGFGTLSLVHPQEEARPRPPRAKRVNQQDFSIVEGQPLPNKGVCEHYKRSYRWLRFPCCQRLFPCDVCHEKKSDGCEPGTWANRMVCGLCSKETGYSNKPCSCGASFGKSAAKLHWEGGKGCRDKSAMSNKDNKKHANSGAKTKSRKSERVGGGNK